MKNNNSFLTRLFSHNITLLILAFLLAFSAWLYINGTAETDSSVTVKDIPIELELSDTAVADGLQIFKGKDEKASVDVRGNRVTVGSLSSSDIIVSSNQTGSITSPGYSTVALQAKKASIKSNYDIVSVSPSSLEIFVDRETEKVLPIDNQITVELDDKNHYANVSLSQNKVSLSGPETQVSMIDSVAVVDAIDDVKTDASGERQEKLHYFDEDGNELNDLDMVMSDIDTVNVTITVQPIVSVDLAVNVSNAPDDAPGVTVKPSSVKIAGPQDTLDSIEDNTVIVGGLDYSKLQNVYVNQKYNITLPSGCKVISGETSAVASVDLTSYYPAYLTAKINSKIDTSTYSVEFASNNVDLTIYGPEEKADTITSSDVSVVADFTGLLDDMKDKSSLSLTIPLKITLGSDYSDCWVYGSYTTTVNVSKK